MLGSDGFLTTVLGLIFKWASGTFINQYFCAKRIIVAPFNTAQCCAAIRAHFQKSNAFPAERFHMKIILELVLMVKRTWKKLPLRKIKLYV